MLVAAGADANHDAGDGWTPLCHAIDIESDAAWQAHYEHGHASTEITALLLAAGAIPTRRAFKLAEDYWNQSALDLLRSHSAIGEKHHQS
jgi:hypothetical protein